MIRSIPVSKYHGCGNDFILCRYAPFASWDLQNLKHFIVSVCDRHTGIGADGCIFVKEDPLEMIYYNQDGSRADMCGNGIRCFAAFCHDEDIVSQKEYPVETLAGTQIIRELSQEPFMVQVNMGKPVFDNARINVDLKEDLWDYPLQIQDQTWHLYSMYMGTIHTVVFTDNAFDESLALDGSALGQHPLFGRQTNVNFVEVLDPSHLKASTWERGCGMTLACGTGMCAAAVAAFQTGKSGPSVDVELKKGTLHIDIDETGTVFLTGPARKIMKGMYEYDEKSPA